jgi:hypothetical protein
MDILTSVEPQLAIPVIGVVLCALLVYIFGFQKTQEPSFQHLAVLQATSKGSRTAAGLRQRSSTPQVKPISKTKEKVVANGHTVQEKSSPKVNGTVKSGKGKDLSNKENVKPQGQKGTPKKEKVANSLAEDLEAGDWIQAVSRKDKKKVDKTKKEVVQPAKVEVSTPVKAVVDDQILKDVTASQAQVETPVKQPVTPTKPAKEPKKKAETVSAPSSSEVSPSKVANTLTEKTEKIVPVKETANQKEKEVVEPEVEVVKEASIPAPVVTAVVEKEPPAEPRSNIAFDEMGDTWEEAKSRGTKKRRARKD